MAQKSEGACKGLSFINWDDLGEEEYQKLDRIINTPSLCLGVQLPFSADCDRSIAPPQPEESTVFHPVIPAAPIVGFPIPIHWANGEPAVCPPPGAHYPITVAAGYSFPNPALTASGQTNVAFVTAVNCVQPIYAVPATSSHHIQSQYQVAPLPQTEPVDLSLPAVKTVDQLFLNPGQSISASSQTHSITVNHVSQGAANISPVTQIVTICHNSMQHPPVSQVLFISQASIAQLAPSLTSSGSECPAYENRSHGNTTATSQSQALTGLPPSPRPPSIEFGGPIVFSNSPTDSNKLFKNTRKDVSISDVNVNKEVVIEMEALNISDIVNSQQIEKQNTNVGDVIIHSTQSPAVHVSSSPVNTSAGSSSAAASIPCKSQEPSAIVADKNTTSEVSLKQAPTPPAKTWSNEDNFKQAPTPPAKMWSSLFGNKGSRTPGPSAAVMSSPGETAAAALPNAVLTDEVKSVKYWQEQERTAEVRQTFVATDKFVPVTVQNDPLAQKILEHLCNLPISHTPIVIQPRGLVNGSNTCFMNATLQVLMGCPPFVHMFRAFKNLPHRPGSSSSTPIFDSLVQFVNSFQNGQRIRNPGSRNKKSAYVDINIGQPFSPTPLLGVAQNILGLHIGVQQDAEEFLSQILMICHEELENVMKLHHANGLNNNEKEHKRNGFPEIITNEGDERGVDDDDDSWLKVGPKNHHVETNVNDCGQTPLSSIFAGLSRSCLIRESGKTSDTVDSFFTLKLDIQAETVHSVTEALHRLNTAETVHDADGGKVQGQRRMFFDVLPPVLIMHLKLFQYSNGNGQKIQKKIDFDVDLVIPKETLSRVGRTKHASGKSRMYKLFGVVNHHGLKMNDGHYTSDVYLPVANGWLHFDDSEVTHIHESEVLQYSERQMPYLLFYRRVDL